MQEQHRNGSLRLTKAERQAADIIMAKIEKRALTEEITAPGKVALDTNRAAQVTLRIGAQLVSRHVRLGHMVKNGLPLVTLSSFAMAKAS